MGIVAACLAVIVCTTLSTNYKLTNDRIIAPYELAEWNVLGMLSSLFKQQKMESLRELEWNKTRESRVWDFAGMLTLERTHAGCWWLHATHPSLSGIDVRCRKNKWYHELKSLTFVRILCTSSYVPFFFRRLHNTNRLTQENLMSLSQHSHIVCMYRRGRCWRCWRWWRRYWRRRRKRRLSSPWTCLFYLSLIGRHSHQFARVPSVFWRSVCLR